MFVLENTKQQRRQHMVKFVWGSWKVVACCFWGGCVGGAHLHNTQPPRRGGFLRNGALWAPSSACFIWFRICDFWGAVWEAPTSTTHNPPAKEGSLGMVLCGRPPLHVLLVSDICCFGGGLCHSEFSCRDYLVCCSWYHVDDLLHNFISLLVVMLRVMQQPVPQCLPNAKLRGSSAVTDTATTTRTSSSTIMSATAKQTTYHED